MVDFKVTPEIISAISEKFCVPETNVENLHSIWGSISGDMKCQYLAHLIRTLEERLRKLDGNEMFSIICTPVANDSPNLGLASSQYYKGRLFVIYYHPNTDEKQLRVMLAHELGHLFLVEFCNSRLGKDYDENTPIEPASTILGIFAILDKNDFYHNKTTLFNHKKKEDVLEDFYLLHNRKQGKLNISG